MRRFPRVPRIYDGHNEIPQDIVTTAINLDNYAGLSLTLCVNSQELPPVGAWYFYYDNPDATVPNPSPDLVLLHIY